MNVYVSSLNIILKSKDLARCTVLVSFALLSVTLTNIFSWIRQTTWELPSILCLKLKRKVKKLTSIVTDGTAVNVPEGNINLYTASV